jgi:hypothetical protein
MYSLLRTSVLSRRCLRVTYHRGKTPKRHTDNMSEFVRRFTAFMMTRVTSLLGSVVMQHCQSCYSGIQEDIRKNLSDAYFETMNIYPEYSECEKAIYDTSSQLDMNTRSKKSLDSIPKAQK